MEIKETNLKGCNVLTPRIIEDKRGRLVKPWHIDDLTKYDLFFPLGEEYYYVSKKNVLRGMHFQTPPKTTKKIVTCLSGKIFDVAIDLRRNSLTFQQYFSIELTSEEGKMLYIPEGFAHGFCVLSDEATVLYLCSEMCSPEYDSGLRWNSVAIEWPVNNPIVSKKDNLLVTLDQFDTPF